MSPRKSQREPASAPNGTAPGRDSAARSASGSASRSKSKPAGFNFTERMRVLCEDIVTRCGELAHIRMAEVAVSFSRCRKDVDHGLQATLTPMRFEGGHLVGFENGQLHTVERLFGKGGQEYRYILSFYMPRFMGLNITEKMITIFHELWHISPQFDGDLRRHPGRCYMHTESEKEYDAKMAVLARQWLAADPPKDLFEFLRYDLSQLSQIHGRVYGQRISQPKLKLVKAAE
ncbi:MAG: hypothetical protein ACI9HK_005219 [Pirellulaceae bacterium]|jgi:hypothetical protein